MTPERWAEIEKLFHRALECDVSERERLLKEAGTADPELRRAVEALISSHESAGAHLQLAVRREVVAMGESARRRDDLALLGTTVDASVASAGTIIGPYHLVNLIGEGGMGEVWLAEQKQPVRRRVALKLIKAGMNTREVMARFESERQALALMDHPAIAKVFDAGSTAVGRPYFVMEYVAGIPLTDYCDKHKLTTRQRLELFILVCEGVQHAHQKAIIHRDLKPSNILVAEVDGKPLPKIIDFGVAKAISQRLTQRTIYTQVGAVIGTMGYMSPEQAELSREDVDTRSDVYSLGVVLYELLVGTLPFDFQKIAFDEALRRLREQDPPKPSTKLHTQDAASTSTAQNRGTDPPTLIRQLRGDADAIALKALEKDRARRYGTPLELAADIGRYLRNEPVSAHSPTALYRARKYIRRNRALAAGTAAVFVVLIAGFVVSTWEATRARRAERVALHDRVRADNEAANANAVIDFLQNDVLAQAGAAAQARPDIEPDPDLKVRTALDRAAARITDKFAGRPLVEASIQQTIGNAYQELGRFPEAQLHLERAVDLRRRVLGEDDPATLRAMSDLALDLFRFQRKYAEAEPLLTKILELQRRALGEYDPATLDTMTKLGDLYRFQGKKGQAEQLLTRALDGFRLVRHEHSIAALNTMNDLALVYQSEGKAAEAQALFLKAFDSFRRRLGEEHPGTLNVANNLADLYRNQRRYPEAEPLYVRVLQVRRRVLGDEHSETWRAMKGLAFLYRAEGKYAQAEPLFSHLLEIQQHLLGSEHPDTMNAMRDLALLYRDEAKYSQAAPLFVTVLQVRRRTLGEERPETLLSMRDLARLYLRQHKYDQAEPLLREALNGYEKTMSTTWDRYICQSMLGASLAGRRQYPQAEPLLISAYQGMTQLQATVPLAHRHTSLPEAAKWIVQLYESWGKPDKAAEWRQKLHLMAVDSANTEQ